MQQAQAQKSKTVDETGPDFHTIEQRHLAGTSHDNRVIPYEGLSADRFTTEQQDLLASIIKAFQELLPAKSLECRLELVRKHLSETYFVWMGGFGDTDAFYYRIQSPVILVELDCHTGVYLSNKTPKRHHIHAIHRIPNGGDYGRQLIGQWRQRTDH